MVLVLPPSLAAVSFASLLWKFRVFASYFLLGNFRQQQKFFGRNGSSFSFFSSCFICVLLLSFLSLEISYAHPPTLLFKFRCLVSRFLLEHFRQKRFFRKLFSLIGSCFICALLQVLLQLCFSKYFLFFIFIWTFEAAVIFRRNGSCFICLLLLQPAQLWKQFVFWTYFSLSYPNATSTYLFTKY